MVLLDIHPTLHSPLRPTEEPAAHTAVSGRVRARDRRGPHPHAVLPRARPPIHVRIIHPRRPHACHDGSVLDRATPILPRIVSLSLRKCYLACQQGVVVRGVGFVGHGLGQGGRVLGRGVHILDLSAVVPEN